MLVYNTKLTWYSLTFRSDVWLCRQTVPQCFRFFSIVCVFLQSLPISFLVPALLFPFIEQSPWTALCIPSAVLSYKRLQCLVCLRTSTHGTKQQSFSLFLRLHARAAFVSHTKLFELLYVSPWVGSNKLQRRIGNQMKTRVWWSRRCVDLQPTKRRNNQPIHFNMVKTQQSKNKPHPATQWWSKHFFCYKHRQKLCTARQQEHNVSSK